MKYTIKAERLKNHIQGLIETIIRTLEEESEDWGLGEMHEIELLNSLNRIEIDRIVAVTKIKVYIDIYLNYFIYDVDEIRSHIQYRLEDWIPNIELYINKIYDVDGDELEIKED